MAESQNSSKQTEAILHAQDYFQILRSRWKEALFVFILVFACCAVITYITTPMYRSSMIFEVKDPRSSSDNLANGSDPVLVAKSEAYMQTEFEAMVSERNLRALAREEELDKEWGVSDYDAAGRLAGMIRVMPVKGTNLVEVTVTTADPQLSRRICRAVHKVYTNVREDKESRIRTNEYKKRLEVLAEHIKKRDAYRQQLKEYIAKGYTIDFRNMSEHAQTNTVDAVEEEISRVSAMIRDMKRSIVVMNSHRDNLKGKSDEDVRDYIERNGLLTAESRPAERIRSIIEALKKENEGMDQLRIDGYGEKHPRMLQMKQQHETTQEELNNALRQFQVAMDDSLAAKKRELRAMEESLETLSAQRMAKLNTDPEVLETFRGYSTESKFCDKMKDEIFSNEVLMKGKERSKKTESDDEEEEPGGVTEKFSEASLPRVQSSPNVKLNLIVGALAGIIAGIVVAIIYNFFDTSVKSLEDAERQLKLPVLGVIPQDAGLLIQQDGESPDVEAYRILRTNIELKKALFKSRTYAVVSANAGEGKTTTLSNLAYVFAKAGNSTLMIDADMRRPRLARYAMIDSSVGLSNYLTSDLDLKDVVFRTGVPNLYILPSGPMPGDASGVLSSFRMEQLLSEAARRFDVVFFDSPPMLGVSDASIIVSKVDATLVVIQPRKMPLKALLRTKSIIENVGGQIMGLVMNNVDISTDSQYQYYTTYYSYYSSDTRRKDKKMPPAKPVQSMSDFEDGHVAAEPVDVPSERTEPAVRIAKAIEPEKEPEENNDDLY